MRYSIVCCSIVLIAACGRETVRRDQLVSADSPVREYSAVQDAQMPPELADLIDAAAKDFHAHRPPDPASFRNVRFGAIARADGAEQHLLCGEFLPTRSDGSGEWSAFATIRTSGYEQWLGAQAATWCERDDVQWAKSDWSEALRLKLEALR